MSAKTLRSLPLGALLICTLAGCGIFSHSAKPPLPTDTLVCSPSAYEWAEGPVEPVGMTMEETEVEDALNRNRWGRDIVRHNLAAQCLRLRDANRLPAGVK